MTPLILTLLFVLIVAVSALVGFVRGLNKSVIRIMTLVLAIVLTFVIAAPVANLIAESVQIQGGTLGEFVLSMLQGKNEMLDGILESAPLLEEAILTAPTFIIGFVLFPVAFLLLSFISWIVFLCIQKPLRKLIFKDNGEKHPSAKVRVGKKFAGLGVGVVTGVLIFAMFMAPLFGLISVLPQKSALDHTVDVLVDQGALTEDLAAIIKGELSVLESPIYTIPANLGLSPIGRTYLASVSKIERDGEVTHLTDEFSTLFAVVETAIEGELVNAVLQTMKSENGDMSPLYDALSNEAFVQELIGDMFDSKLLRSAIPEVTAIALESAAIALGVPANKEVVYDNMMDSIANLVNESDIDFDGIHAYEEANGITYIDLMYADSQERTLMTEEEYKKEIKKVEKLEKDIAKVVNKNVAGGTESIGKGIAKEFVKGVKEQAKNEGSEAVKTFDPTKVKEKMSEIKPENIVVEPAEGETGADAAAISEMLGKIQEPEKFETKVTTVETVKESIRETVKEAVKDDSKTKETADTLANVVSNFAGAVSSATDETGKLDATKLDFEKVGNAVGSLQGSTLNDVGSTVLGMVSSSETLGSNEMVSSAVGAIKDAYDKGEEIAETVKTTGDILDLVTEMESNKGNEGTSEGLINSFEKLVKGLTETTLNLLPNIITDEVMMGMGVPEEHASAAYGVIDTLLRELMKLKGAADYDNEVNAVISIYNIATSGVENIGKEDLSKLSGYAINSDAIFNTLTSVSASNPFGIDIKSESTRKDLADAIEEGYAKDVKDAADKQRVYDVYDAVAKLLGIEDEVELTK